MSLESFKSLVDLDLSRDNRFVAHGPAIPPPPLNQLLQNVSLPGITYSTADWRDYGPPRKFPYDIIFGELTLTFLDTPGQAIKNFYDDWTVNEVYRRDGFGYMRDYVRDCTIEKLTRRDAIGYTVKVFDAYPSIIEPIQLNSASRDTLSTVSVSLIYLKWEVL